MSIRNNTVGTTEITPVETEVTKSEKQESRDIGRGRFKKAIEAFILTCFGGSVYVIMEILWRGYSHWAMFFVGGLAFLCVGAINEIIPWDVPLIVQMIVGGQIITMIEFLSGCVLNLWLKWDIWDYSNLPFNVLGQICLPFSLLWCLVSLIAILLDDWLRWKLFGEEKPHYKIV